MAAGPASMLVSAGGQQVSAMRGMRRIPKNSTGTRTDNRIATASAKQASIEVHKYAGKQTRKCPEYASMHRFCRQEEEPGGGMPAS